MAVRGVAGVDGGGSRTVAWVADASGRPVGRGVAGPANPYGPGGPAGALREVRRALDAALAAAGARPADLAALVLAVAGAGRAAEQHPLVRAAAGWGVGGRVVAVPDIEAAWLAATRGRPGVVVVAGTGSGAWGRDARGRTARAGGWGPLLGDEGSAFDLAREALRAAARGHDGRGPATALAAALSAALGVSGPEALVPRVYGGPGDPRGRVGSGLGRVELAGLAPVVTRLAAAGDAVARELCARAGQALGEAAAAVLRALDLCGGTPLVAAGGGLVLGAIAEGAGAALWDPFVATVRAAAPRARVEPARLPAVAGAVALALEAAGAPIGPRAWEALGAWARQASPGHPPGGDAPAGEERHA